ncbi:signal peptide containing protein [Theileria equi strain WA]|uniref:Signal peptide containing protein n=1 Tax=Theileria equi strain WA TaxID=1537102 RepID=L1L9Z0_THEEQ|nr:signal peptide containing protein [Theileria equi strain WA]EKX72010.1 signal peptide containing protein [Theileria equi strain WA]|eukprot:XP_004831462.1 signal peptide containing protein [Theileria equi strain WA]
MELFSILYILLILQISWSADDEKSKREESSRVAPSKEPPKNPTGITLDIDKLDPSQFSFNEYYYDGVHTQIIVPHEGVTVIKVLQSLLTIWMIRSYEKFEYCKIYMKNGKPHIVSVTKSNRSGVKHANYLRAVGRWKNCDDLTEQINKLKVPISSDEDMIFNLVESESNRECNIFATNIVGSQVRFYFPNPGYTSTKVVYGTSLVWNSTGDKRCIACDLYFENEKPSFVILSIKDHGHVDHIYIGKNADESWGDSREDDTTNDEVMPSICHESDDKAGAHGDSGKDPQKIDFTTTSPSKDTTTNTGRKLGRIGKRIGSFRFRTHSFRVPRPTKPEASTERSEASESSRGASEDLHGIDTWRKDVLETKIASGSESLDSEPGKSSSSSYYDVFSEVECTSPVFEPAVVRPKVRTEPRKPDGIPTPTMYSPQPKELVTAQEEPAKRLASETSPTTPTHLYATSDLTTLNLQFPDYTSCKSFNYNCEGVQTRWTIPLNCVITKLVNIRSEIWNAKPGEEFVYTKAYLNKDGQPEIVLVVVKSKDSISKKYYKHKNGLWPRSKKCYSEKIKTLKSFTPKKGEFTIILGDENETAECNIFNVTILDTQVRALIPKPGNHAILVVHGEHTLWKAENNKHCLFAYLYFKDELPYLVRMKIRTLEGSEHKFFKKDAEKWVEIALEDFVSDTSAGLVTHIDNSLADDIISS